MRSKLLQTRNLFLIYLLTSIHTTRWSVHHSSDLLRCTFHKRTLFVWDDIDAVLTVTYITLCFMGSFIF